MDAGVGCQFRVERGDEMAALFGEDRIAVVGGEHSNGRARDADDGRADEDRFEVAERGRKGDDARIELTAIGITLNVDIHKPERLLFGGGDMGSKKDGSGAGTEDGLGRSIGSEGLEEALAMEDL